MARRVHRGEKVPKRNVTILFPDGVVPRSDGRQETLQIDGYVFWSVSTGQVTCSAPGVRLP